MDYFRVKVKTEDIEDYMEQFLCDNPFIGVELDTRYCSWIRYYHSRYHSLLIMNYNSLLRMLSIKQIMKKKNNRECVEIINEIMNSEHEAYKKIKSYI